MHTLLFFQIILLILPNSSLTLPAQPILPLGSIATGNDTLSAILGGDWDPRFEVRAIYQEVPLDEDQVLVEAVQVVGELAQMPLNQPIVEAAYADVRLPSIGITVLGPGGGRPVQVRFLTGGLYLGMQHMIESRMFRRALFVIRWDRQLVGSIYIGIPRHPVSLPGGNFTNDVRQASSPHPLGSVPSPGLSRNSSTLSVPDTLSGRNIIIKMDNLNIGRPLSKYDLIMAFMTVVFAAASSKSQDRIPPPGAQITAPPPFEARMQILPEQTAPGQPYVNLKMVALISRQIPGILLLQVRQWAEVRFQVEADDVFVATCVLKRGGAGLGVGESGVL